MGRPLTVLLALLLLASTLAGCLGGGDETGPGPELSSSASGGTGAGDASSVLSADSEVQAPGWQVGQWFAWELMDGEVETSWTTVVAEDEGSSWLTLPTEPNPARMEAMFDWYVIGSMAKESLADTVAPGLAFYDFPLSDGKTWESTFGPSGDALSLHHQATFDPAIQTAQGPLPGYEIEAHHNGSLFFHYDYVPAIGWFSKLVNHELPEEGGDGTVDWTYTVTDWGTNHTGPLYRSQAEMLVDTFHEVDANPDRPDANPSPHASFTVAEDAGSLFVVAGAYTVAGATQTTLVDPEHGTHQLTATSTSLDGAFAGMGHFMDVIPGRWDALMGGAGGDTEGWVLAWQTFDEERTL